MVKLNRPSVGAGICRGAVTEWMKLIGRTLTRRRVVEVFDELDGDITSITRTDTTFTGDLQFGLDLDERFVQAGVVQVGEGVLYVEYNGLDPIIEPQDEIVDGNSVWEVINGIESPEINGSVQFYSYRCRRRIEEDDS